jgi:AraC family transcriptional regulator
MTVPAAQSREKHTAHSAIFRAIPVAVMTTRNEPFIIFFTTLPVGTHAELRPPIILAKLSLIVITASNLSLYKFAHDRQTCFVLRYLTTGTRRFGLHPMYVHQRANWEFLAVIRGRCAPLFANAPAPALRQRHLWLFPPENAHGWQGHGPQTCRVAIFHFGAVPSVLGKLAHAQGYLERSLTPFQLRRVLELQKELRPHYEHVTEKSLLIFEKALLDLSLMMLEDVPFENSETKTGHAIRKVEASLTWYSEHIAAQPSLEQIAAAVHVSASHLRRLFWQARQESPQKAFARLRVQRAMEFLSHSELKLEAIASRCGFSSSSDFCRVFKNLRHTSPDAWRRKQIPSYQEPAGPSAPDIS